MSSAGRAAARPMIPGRNGPAIIAHGGGNTIPRIADAIAGGADFLEVDLWVHKGRFEARHERAAYPLPLLFEKWYFRRPPRTPFGLAELLREAAGRARVFLDLKNGDVEAARLVRRSLDEAGPGVQLTASAQQWRILRAVAREAPEIDLFYSIDVAAKLDLFFSVIERDMTPKGVSCRQTLLTEPLVERLHAKGLAVVAWTVDDVDRARTLASWGVEGITTHRPAEVRAAVVTDD
jgi:glycerophosphoryl diester phosphodiesterase